LDLRFIREIHILDAWFHLNKTEQIIGRGIRFCSHSLIEDPKKRNTTVFLHAIAFPERNKETADLYCYRNALKKAILVGQVSRQLKRFAIDCNLRKQVTVLRGLGNRVQTDSQGVPRLGNDPEKPGIPIDDTDFTVLCDWMECPYTCDPPVDVNPTISDDSTYDAFSAQYRETFLQKIIQRMFTKQPYYSAENFINVLLLTGTPRAAIDMAIQSIVQNRQFRIKSNGQEGYIIYKNKYFLFQPDIYRDLSIPMALRIADFPIKRDSYTPVVVKDDSPSLMIGSPTTKSSVLEESSKEGLWNALVQWTANVISGKQTTIGVDIERQIELFTGDFRQQRDVYTNKLAMILFLAKKMTAKRDLYKQVVLEYMWDEWIHPKEQARLLSTKNPIYTDIASEEQLLRDGPVTVIRYVDPDTNKIEFVCDNGLECSKGVLDYFSKLPGTKDPVKTRTAAPHAMGSLYGFIVPKRGAIIFKTLEPQDKLKAVSGQECAIVTTKSHWYDKLIQLGNEMKHARQDHLDMDEGHLATSMDIINSTRGCTVLDLVLRSMDKLQIRGKRWFFRPVAAYMSGHRGVVSASVKSATDAVQKELKKQETLLAKSATAAARSSKKSSTAAPAKPTVATAPIVTAPKFKKFVRTTEAPITEEPAISTLQPDIPIDLEEDDKVPPPVTQSLIQSQSVLPSEIVEEIPLVQPQTIPIPTPIQTAPIATVAPTASAAKVSTARKRPVQVKFQEQNE
jgi:hypothetical protein